MPELLTIAEAAATLGVSRRTVYRWIDNGTLPALDEQGTLRIAADDLERVATPTRSRTPATTGDVRQHVLDAAAAVLAADGHGALTIEQVATAAGMSVGGVTYHFPTKAALLDDLVDAFLDQFEHDWSAERTRGRSNADAYIAVSLAGPRHRRTRAILLAALEHPPIVRRIDRRVRTWYRRIEADSSTPDADVQRCLAADAVWLFGLLGVRPLSGSRALDTLRVDR